MLNICPSSNDGAEHHKAEREQSHSGDTTATEPEHLSVGSNNDGHVLEYGVDWDGEVLQGFRSCVDQSNQEKRYGKPLLLLEHSYNYRPERHTFLGLIEFEIPVVKDTYRFTRLDRDKGNGRLNTEQQKVEVEVHAR